MIGAEDQAHHVRHHDADKTDNTRQRNGHGCHKRCHDQERVFRRPDIHTQLHSGFLALHHQVEFSRLRVKNSKTNEQTQGGPGGFFKRRAGQIAHQPEADAVQLHAVHNGQGKKNGGGKKELTTTPASSSELSNINPRDPPATINTRKTVTSAPQNARNGTPR